MSEPCDLSAVDARAAIGEGRLSPVELLDSCIKRIEAVNPAVNAIVATCFDRARREAKAAEAAVYAGDPLPPLHGLPVTIKDLVATQGLRTTWGSTLHANDIPDHDEAVVTRLRQAGAIVIGKTNTPEFGSGTNTTNDVYGSTKNPFDLARTCGGSSGGAAVGLATGMSPLAQGSDTGGSLRCPATWCGVTGFRPTPGLVPKEGRTLNYTHFNVLGPMARSAADIALMMQGMAADDSRDALAGPVDGAAFAGLPEADLSGLRVAWSEDLGVAPVDDGIRAAFRAGVDAISGCFKSCRQADPDMTGARDISWTLRSVNYVATHSERYARHRDVLSPNIIANMEAGEAMSLADVAWAEREWARLYRRFQDFFAEIDLLIVPGNAVPPFPLATGIPKEVNGVPMENYMDASLVRSALTLTGHPVIAVPCGVDHLGLPFGFQVVAKRRADAFLLRSARAMEDFLNKNTATARPVPDLEALTK